METCCVRFADDPDDAFSFDEDEYGKYIKLRFTTDVAKMARAKRALPRWTRAASQPRACMFQPLPKEQSRSRKMVSLPRLALWVFHSTPPKHL